MNITAISPTNYIILEVSDKSPSETGRKILGFERLERGWHFGEGHAPNRALINKAMELDATAQDLGFSNTDAFPGPNGELRFCVYNGDAYYEFTLETNGSVTMVIENNGVESHIVFSFEEAKNQLKRVSIWNTSDLFTGDIGTSEGRISKRWHFRTRPRTERFRSFKRSAQNETALTSVQGSTGFTPDTRHVLQSGFLTTNYFQKELGSATSQVILGTSAIETCAA